MKKSIQTPFTVKIREACKKHGISIREFLRRAGLPTSAIYRWETGHKPKPAMVDHVESVMEELSNEHVG